MKKLFSCLVVAAALVFAVGCGGEDKADGCGAGCGSGCGGSGCGGAANKDAGEHKHDAANPSYKCEKCSKSKPAGADGAPPS